MERRDFLKAGIGTATAAACTRNPRWAWHGSEWNHSVQDVALMVRDYVK